MAFAGTLASHKIATALHPRKFGTFLLTVLAIVLIILKIMNDYTFEKGTIVYQELTGIMLAMPFFIAIALTLIFHRLVIGYKTMILMFIFWLIIAYVILTPVLLSGV
jgi:hypothetical protein